MGPGVDDPNSHVIKAVMDRVRLETPGLPVELTFVSRETDGRLTLVDQFGTNTGPHRQTRPAYVPAANQKMWAIPMAGKFLVISP